MDYAQYNNYLSNYNNNEFFSIQEVIADLFSIEMIDYFNIKMNQDINNEQNEYDTTQFYNYLVFLKYFNYKYKEFCQSNEIEEPYYIKSDIKNDKRKIYLANENSIKNFSNYIYKNKTQFGRKIVKCMRNIRLMFDD